MTITDLDQDAPKTDAGDEFPFALLTDTAAVYAESATELLGALIPGYAELLAHADDEALVLRYVFAAEEAKNLQAIQAAQAEAEGTFNPETAGEEALTTLFEPKTAPCSFEGEWTLPVPLTLVRTDYDPFTSRTLPTGNIVWLDPHTEMTLLLTLQTVGALDLLMKE